MYNVEECEIIANYLLESKETRALGCNEYTYLIQIINRKMNLFGRDLENNELSFFTTILMSYIADIEYIDGYNIIEAITEILKTYEKNSADENMTITKFLEELKDNK